MTPLDKEINALHWARMIRGLSSEEEVQLELLLAQRYALSTPDQTGAVYSDSSQSKS